MRKSLDRDIPLDFLREAIVYDPLTGALTWLHRPREHFSNAQSWGSWNTKYSGKPAGTRTSAGYVGVSLTYDGRLRQIPGHRIAFALMTGDWPEHEVDHRHGDRAHNPWSNLRAATPRENRQNQALNSRSKSGLRGVWQDKRSGKWCFGVMADGKRIRRGGFAAPEETYTAYLAAKAELHPFQPAPRDG